jgi:hypothetical protein
VTSPLVCLTRLLKIPSVCLVHFHDTEQESKLKPDTSRAWWLMPIILATQEAEIRRIEVQGQPRQIVYETLSRKYPTTQHTAGGVAQV